jgi:hypothetical protein
MVVAALALVLAVVFLVRSRDTGTLLPAPPSGSRVQGTEAQAKGAVAQLSGNLIAMSEVDAGWYGTHVCRAFEGDVSWDRFLLLADELHADTPETKYPRQTVSLLMGVYCRPVILALLVKPVPPDLLPSPETPSVSPSSSQRTTPSLSPTRRSGPHRPRSRDAGAHR